MDLGAELERFVRWVMRDVTYHRQYACTVMGQSEDLDTLDVLPDDESIRGTGLQSVRIRHGLPGLKIRAKAGVSRVLLGYEDGDPRRPYVSDWDRVGSLEITLQPDEATPIRIVTSGAPIELVSDSTITIQSPDVRLGAAPSAEIATRGDMIVVSAANLAAAIGSMSTPKPLPLVGMIATGVGSAKA